LHDQRRGQRRPSAAKVLDTESLSSFGVLEHFQVIRPAGSVRGMRCYVRARLPTTLQDPVGAKDKVCLRRWRTNSGACHGDCPTGRARLVGARSPGSASTFVVRLEAWKVAATWRGGRTGWRRGRSWRRGWANLGG
jgi:hypothetical protein